MFVEGFGGGLPAENLSRSAVEGGGDRLDLGCGPSGEVGAFGEVLAQQPVGVLVGAALPRALGVGEEDGYVGLGGELGVG